MPGLTRDAQELLGGWLVHGSDMPTAPAGLTLTFYTTSPGDDIGDGDDGYFAVTPQTLSTSGDWTVSTETSGHSYAENAVTLEFGGDGSAGWADLVAVALWDGTPGATDATALWLHEFDDPVSKESDMSLVIEPGDLIATVGDLQNTEPGP